MIALVLLTGCGGNTYPDSSENVKTETIEDETINETQETLQVDIRIVDQTGRLIETLLYPINTMLDLESLRIEDYRVSKFEVEDQQVLRPILVKKDIEVVAQLYNSELSFEPVQNGYLVTGLSKDVDEVLIPSTYKNSPVIGIKDYAFQNSDIRSVIVPTSLEFIGIRAFESSAIESVDFLEPSQLRRIELDAFAKTNFLSSITLPEGLQVLGQGVFYLSRIQDIELPSTLETITRYALSYASELRSIQVHPDNSSFATEDGVLYNKNFHHLIYWPPANDSSVVTLRSGVNHIEKYAFENNHRSEVILPPSVVSFNEDSFYNAQISTIRLSSSSQMKMFTTSVIPITSTIVVPIDSNKEDLSVLIVMGYSALSEDDYYKLNARSHSISVNTNAWVQSSPNESLVPFTNWNQVGQSDMVAFFIHASESSQASILIPANIAQSILFEVLINDKWFGSVEMMNGETWIRDISLLEGYNRIEFTNFSVSPLRAQLKFEMFEIYHLDASVQLTYSPNDYRRMPASVSTFHTLPNEDIEWIYSEITVEEDQDVLYTYFMANGFAEGYFGMQSNMVDPRDRWILFSVWSPYETDDPRQIPSEYQVDVLDSGPRVQINTFGNEGSGRQSYLRFPWQTGVSYGFLTRIVPVLNQRTRYESYFYDPVSETWYFIASMERPFTSTYAKNFYSFIEVYVPTNAATSRYGLYNNYWVRTKEGVWSQVRQSITYPNRIDASGNIRYDYRAQMTDQGLLMETGGYRISNDYASRSYRWDVMSFPSHLEQLPQPK